MKKENIRIALITFTTFQILSPVQSQRALHAIQLLVAKVKCRAQLQERLGESSRGTEPQSVDRPSKSLYSNVAEPASMHNTPFQI
ncbi:hypothetical protein E2P81_ATG01862 [Venturia nashicola]|nr:hypothetical protein E2P81_ATG01862 [Venturia nashicola]